MNRELCIIYLTVFKSVFVLCELFMSQFRLLQDGSDYFIIFNYFIYLTQGKICTNGTIVIVDSHVNIPLISHNLKRKIKVI